LLLHLMWPFRVPLSASLGLNQTEHADALGGSVHKESVHDLCVHASTQILGQTRVS